MSGHAEQNFPHARLTTFNSTTDQIVAVKTGKLDLIASALAISPERQKQVAFFTPYAEVSSGGVGPEEEPARRHGGRGAGRGGGRHGGRGGGSRPGRRGGWRLLRWFGSTYIFLIRGLSVLLLLMLIFYVAFAAVNINPLLVAAIAFGMNFGAYVSEMFRTGIEGVDRGQTEAGIAMVL